VLILLGGWRVRCALQDVARDDFKASEERAMTGPCCSWTVCLRGGAGADASGPRQEFIAYAFALHGIFFGDLGKVCRSGQAAAKARSSCKNKEQLQEEQGAAAATVPNCATAA